VREKGIKRKEKKGGSLRCWGEGGVGKKHETLSTGIGECGGNCGEEMACKFVEKRVFPEFPANLRWPRMEKKSGAGAPVEKYD